MQMFMSGIKVYDYYLKGEVGRYIEICVGVGKVYLMVFIHFIIFDHLIPLIH